MAITNFIILDIMLPEMNGIEVCKATRKVNANIPILFLTALGTAENIVHGLGIGADDYLVKPFKFIELVARIKTILRRSESGSTSEPQLDSEYTMNMDDLVLNDYTKTVTRSNKLISLTSTEYRLLHFFMKNQNRVLSRMDILEEVWGINHDLGTNVVDVYVNYLRKKMDNDPDKKIAAYCSRHGVCIKISLNATYEHSNQNYGAAGCFLFIAHPYGYCVYLLRHYDLCL